MNVKGHHRTVPLASLKRRDTRISPGSEEELKALALSWMENPIHDILVDADFSVADGNRRLKGLELLGATEVNVCVLDTKLSAAEMDDIALVTAYHRAPLGGYEQARIIHRRKEAVPGTTNKAVAEYFHIDAGMVTRYEALWVCIPEAQKAAKEGLLTVSKWYAISKADDQHAALQRALHGASRDSLEGSRTGQATRKWSLPSGYVVTVSGTDVGFEQCKKALTDAINAMKAELKPQKSAAKAAAVTESSNEPADPTATAVPA